MSSNFSENFERHFATYSKTLLMKENNENWEKISKALLSIIDISVEEDGQHPEFINKIKPVLFHVQKYILSDRTVLSHSAVKLVTHLSQIMKKKFSALVQLLIPAIIDTLGKTNVLFRNRASECLGSILKSTHLAALIPLICGAAASKSVIVRPFGVKLVEELVIDYPEMALRSKHEVLESTIKTSLSDPKAEIRSCARSIFWSYLSKLPDREASLAGKLPREIFKYLSQDKTQVLPYKPLFASPPSTQAPTVKSSPITSTCVFSRNSSCSSLSSNSKPLKTNVVLNKLPDLSKVKSKVFSHLTTKPTEGKVESRETSSVAPQPKSQSLFRSASHIVTKTDKVKTNFILKNALQVKNSLSNRSTRTSDKSVKTETKSNILHYKKTKPASAPSLTVCIKSRSTSSLKSLEKKKLSQSIPEIKPADSSVSTIVSQKKLDVPAKSPVITSAKRSLELDGSNSVPSPKRIECSKKDSSSPVIDIGHPASRAASHHEPSIVSGIKDPENSAFHHSPILKESSTPGFCESHPPTDSTRPEVPLSTISEKAAALPVHSSIVSKPNLAAFGSKPFLFRNRIKPSN